MKVECINNASEKQLIIGKEYVVYAISEFDGVASYCISDKYFPQPMWYPFSLFKITDPRISRFWIFNLIKNLNEKTTPFLGFPEWANDDYFYHDIVERENNAETIFAEYQELMDLEFPDFNVLESAQIGDEGWLICPKCIDAWENSDKSYALVICPKCKTTFNNPRYKNELPHL